MRCPWDGSNPGYEPLDSHEAEKVLCRWHLAEYEGTSLDGLDREDAGMRADRDALGYND